MKWERFGGKAAVRVMPMPGVLLSGRGFPDRSVVKRQKKSARKREKVFAYFWRGGGTILGMVANRWKNTFQEIELGVSGRTREKTFRVENR